MVNKRLLLVSIFCFILFSVIVTAKCGDEFCDPEEGKRYCRLDCLLEGESCSLDLNSQECESLVCSKSTGLCVSNASNINDIFAGTIRCNQDKTIDFTATFQSIGSTFGTTFDSEEDIIVYFKKNDKDSSFSELKGTWFYQNAPVKEIVSGKIHIFKSNTKYPIEEAGEYNIRVKYKSAGTRALQIGQDQTVTCGGTKSILPNTGRERKIGDRLDFDLYDKIYYDYNSYDPEKNVVLKLGNMTYRIDFLYFSKTSSQQTDGDKTAFKYRTNFPLKEGVMYSGDKHYFDLNQDGLDDIFLEFQKVSDAGTYSVANLLFENILDTFQIEEKPSEVVETPPEQEVVEEEVPKDEITEEQEELTPPKEEAEESVFSKNKWLILGSLIFFFGAIGALLFLVYRLGHMAGQMKISKK